MPFLPRERQPAPLSAGLWNTPSTRLAPHTTPRLRAASPTCCFPAIPGRSPLPRGQGKTQEIGWPLQIGRCGCFNKQGDFTRLVSTGSLHQWIFTSAARIFKVYSEALMRFSRVTAQLVSTTHCSHGGCVLETGSSCRNTGLNVHSKDRGGSRELLNCPGSSPRVNWRLCPLDDLPLLACLYHLRCPHPHSGSSANYPQQ